jgi:hypothetical protein
MNILLQCSCETTTETEVPFLPDLPVSGMGWASGVSGGVPNWIWLLTALMVIISILSTIYLLRQMKGVW